MASLQNTPVALVFESRPTSMQNIVNRSALYFRYPSLFYPFQSLFPSTNTKFKCHRSYHFILYWTFLAVLLP